MEGNVKSDADILAEAREYIEEHGWIQMGLLNKHGQVCGFGAVAASQGWIGARHVDSTRVGKVYALTRKVLAAAVGQPAADCEWDGYVDWNDAPGRTVQEVLDAFAKAEKIERTGFDPDRGVTVDDR